MSRLRKVELLEWWRPKCVSGGTFLKRKVGIGIFHQFGSAYEEFDSGAGNYSTAIVEMADGNVRNMEVELIRFTGETISR